MLLRLHVRGFKNLKDVEIRFGPLTCFVGPNGVGKSNLFDAIQFLRSLADNDIQTAAQSVRSPHSGAFGPKELVWGGGGNQTMAFTADMIVPESVYDDFGRRAEPTTTLLRYEVEFHCAEGPVTRLELVREELVGLKAGDAKGTIGFPHTPLFRKSAVKPTRRVGPLISTETEGDTIKVMLHQDGGSRGQPIPAGVSPRTVVGGTNAAEYPTVLAARREMASWQLLQLEPSEMRAPDRIGGPDRVSERGGHIAAALARLVTAETSPGRTMADAANRLAELVPEVKSLSIDRDEARQQISFQASMRGASRSLGPRSLSDGTLRFLALVTLQMDPTSCGILCMEEPENGMHPSRVPAMVKLLRDFVVDADEAIGPDNPARQVIVNTHSPDVVRQLSLGEVVFVETIDGPDGRSARVAAIKDGWREEGALVPRQYVADFMGGAPPSPEMEQLHLPLVIGSAQ